ncbi:MAG: hypothetical protein J2P21_30670, partial [Chloracidobacterium sp.]|nr:hypothetical protein [Chloracidobacterium sp.]
TNTKSEKGSHWLQKFSFETPGGLIFSSSIAYKDQLFRFLNCARPETMKIAPGKDQMQLISLI